MALRHRFRDRYGTDIDAIWSDDGIAFRFPDSESPPGTDDLLLDPEDVEALLVDHIADTALFAARFREAAGRSLLLPRRRPGERTPLWLQRRRSADLLGVTRQFGSFPIMLEVYREILQDDFDLPGLVQVLTDIRARRIRITPVETDSPSPFASSLLFSFIAAYLYEADAPLAERRAAALTLDRDLLRELLGEGELRELIDPEVVAAVELELQYLTDRRRVTRPDGVHDMLRDLGPLTMDDIEVRTEGLTVPTVLRDLEAQRRVVEIVLAGTTRWAAVEDISRLRDALGVQPPAGMANVFLDPVEDPLADVIGRYARTHGPFTVTDAAEALFMPAAIVETILRQLEARGRVDVGAFRPGGRGQEFVDREVLRRLKRRSLAVLRREIEAVGPAWLAAFSVGWHGIQDDPPRGLHALTDALSRLSGSVLPASVLERDILAGRVEEPGPMLDRLLLEGDLVWIGHDPLGTSDGKLALYPRSSLGVLWRGPGEMPDAAEAAAIVDYLEGRGASFFRDIYNGVGGGDPGPLLDHLWDLVWSGWVTNDTLAPVRAFTQRRSSRSSGRRALASQFPAHAGGRWSLTRHLARSEVTETERHAAWAQLLVDRYGVLTRGAVLAEGYPGGFTALYPVLSHLEETGRLRRGYFVEGLGGSQFALPGAVDRLRLEPVQGVTILAATDPANPYGTTLVWPDVDGARLARDAGAYVFLRSGQLIGYLDKGRRNLTVLAEDTSTYESLGRALSAIATRHRRTTVNTVNGRPAPKSPLAPALVEWGFASAPKGLTYRG
jgi:ATP-dependent Lhr-like helicase